MRVESTIDVRELKELSSRVLDALLENGIEKIEVDQPQYWAVDPQDSFRLSRAPDLLVGNVWDDLGDLRVEVEGSVADLSVWHACDHLAGLIKLVAAADLRRETGAVAAEEQGG